MEAGYLLVDAEGRRTTARQDRASFLWEPLRALEEMSKRATWPRMEGPGAWEQRKASLTALYR